jgi:histidine ammonia-lyase
MSDNIIHISKNNLTLSEIRTFQDKKLSVSLSKEIKDRIKTSRKVVENILKADKSVYGVNTGFGKFSDIRIDNDQVEELQKRLIYSHAAGTGEPITPEIVRLIMLLKIKALSFGHSGCRLEVISQLVQMLNKGIIPMIPEKGSVGASGDLAPLAHMALVMIGEGEAFISDKKKGEPKWKKVNGIKALETFDIKPIHFKAKEGLAVLNGTQVSTAFGIATLIKAGYLLRAADIVAAITIEGLLGTLTPFDIRIQEVRPHPGQRQVAANIRKILRGSPVVASHKEEDDRVQDAYSLRCIPQIHGAVRDALTYVKKVLEAEMNSVTDNPLIFPEEQEVLSGGNFHAAPVGYACDLLSIVLSDLTNIVERRIEHMQDPNVSLLPGFLTKSGGLNSGFMIAHVTAAALSSENKVLAHPASVDSIPTSANKEDHVSMATHAARKALTICENLEEVLAIELISACQALDLRRPLRPSTATKAVIDLVRSKIPFWEEDRQIFKDMQLAKDIIRSGSLLATVESVCGKIN